MITIIITTTIIIYHLECDILAFTITSFSWRSAVLPPTPPTQIEIEIDSRLACKSNCIESMCDDEFWCEFSANLLMQISCCTCARTVMFFCNVLSKLMICVKNKVEQLEAGNLYHAIALSYNLAYQEIISVHPRRRQIFAGKPHSTFWNIWEWVISCLLLLQIK